MIFRFQKDNFNLLCAILQWYLHDNSFSISSKKCVEHLLDSIYTSHSWEVSDNEKFIIFPLNEENAATIFNAYQTAFACTYEKGVLASCADDVFEILHKWDYENKMGL